MEKATTPKVTTTISWRSGSVGGMESSQSKRQSAGAAQPRPTRGYAVREAKLPNGSAEREG